MVWKHLVREHLEFTSRTFPKATAMGAVIHTAREVEELGFAVAEEESRQRVAEELADVFACLLDFASRYGIDEPMLHEAFAQKLAINKAREWQDNGDGSYSHIKR